MTDDDYLDVAQTQELSFAKIRQLKARIAELEGALREWIEGAERVGSVNNFEKVTCYMRGPAAVAHARQVLEAKHEE